MQQSQKNINAKFYVPYDQQARDKQIWYDRKWEKDLRDSS